MAVVYVPRIFGGLIVFTPSGLVPPVLTEQVTATRRDNVVIAVRRDQTIRAVRRDEMITTPSRG